MEPLVRVPVAPGAPFRLPPKLEGLRRLAYNLWWSWHPRARILFCAHRRRRLGALPQPDPGPAGPGRLGAAARQPGVHGRVPGRPRASSTRTWPTARTTGSSAAHGERARRARSPTSAPSTASTSRSGIYSGGLGVLAGDHMKAASDMALPLVGVGLMYRHGYFRQTIDADGHQEHAYPDYELSRLPILRALDARRRAAHGHASRCPGATCRGASGSSRSAGCRSCCSTPTSPTTTTRTGRSPTSCTSAAARCASTRSSSWASAACGRCARWASTRRSGTSTRATRRSCSPSGRASWSPAGATLDDALDAGPRATACSRSTPRSRRATSGSTPTSSAGSPARCSTATGGPSTGGVPVERVLELGLGVEGDPGQFDMTAFSPAPDPRRQRRLAAPRRRPRTRPGSGIARREILGHHQRRPHADLGRPADARRCSSGTLDADLDDDGRRARRAALLGAHRASPGGRAVGGAPAPEAGARDLRPRPAAQPVRPPRRGAGDARGARGGPRPGDPDDRLRAPVRDLQAGRRCCSPTSTGWRACCGTRSGRSRSSSPARPTPPTGPARA